MKVTILTEGSRELGLGHIIRCISLYQAFEAENIEVEIVAYGNGAVEEILAPFSHQIVNWINKPQVIGRLIKDTSIVIVDSRLVDKTTCDEIAKIVKVPVFVDDTQRLTYSRGIVINRTVLAEIKNYPKRKGLIYLLGSKYMPLTKAFWYAPVKPIHKKIRRILISFGGSDPKNQTNIIANYLLNHYSKFIFDIIIGNSFGKSSIDLKKSKRIFLHSSLSGEQMKNLMLRSDIAISAGGQTLFELARIGVPSIGVQVVDNQTDNITSLIKSGFLDFAGHCDDSEVLQNIVTKIKLLRSYEMRKRRNIIGRSLIDGYGSVRIASFLLGAYRFS